jgi:hypothetical protein
MHSYHEKHYQVAIYEKNGRVLAHIRLHDSYGLQLHLSDMDEQIFNNWKQSRRTEK